MSFAMFMGFVTGMIAGLIAVAVGFRYNKKRKGLVEEDERTELISARAGRTALIGAAILAFVAWVTENIVRHADGLDVDFFSPWAIMLAAGVILYLAAWYYEGRKLSDPDAEPDEQDKKRMRMSMVALGCSICSLSAIAVTAGSRIDRSIFVFLIGFELLMMLIVGVLFGRMARHKRTKA